MAPEEDRPTPKPTETRPTPELDDDGPTAELDDEDDLDDDGDDGDEVTDVEHTSWLERLGQSFAGMVVGFLLIIGSCVLLFWNEGRAITTARSLTEGGNAVLAVDSARVDPANEGKLVHVAGLVAVAGPVVDAEFGMRSTGLRLIRRVEMFQWIEEEESDSKRKVGGSEEKTTKYKYTRAWSSEAQDSSKFRERAGHANPQMTYRERNLIAPQPKIGAFTLPGDLLANFGTDKPLAATDNQVTALQRKLNKPVQAVDGVIYIARNPGQPVVGDIRITYGEVPLQDASVVARQAGNALGPYQTRAGGKIQLIAVGIVPAADLFKAALDDNRLLTWAIRAGGCVLMFIGFGLILGPLAVLGDLIPIIGDVIRAGIGLVGLLGTAILAPLVIAIGWFWYRPLIAAGILVAGGLIAFGTIWLARQHKQRKLEGKPQAA